MFLFFVLFGVLSLRADTPTIVTDLQAGQPSGDIPIVSSPPVPDAITGIARSSAGSLYVAGRTNSSLFPLPQPITSGMKVAPFVARLDASGIGYDAVQMLNTTNVPAIATDSAGNVYLAGSAIAPSGSTLIGPGGTYDVVVTKLDSSLANVLWQVFIGGSGENVATGLAVDEAGNAYVTGGTTSTDWPITAGAFQSVNRASNGTGYIAVVAASGSSLLWSTYLGGSNSDNPSAIAIGQNGSVYVAGTTGSSDFPTPPGAFQPTFHSNPTFSASFDGFIAELSSDGTKLLASTFLAGTGGNDDVLSLAADPDGSVTVAGSTDSADFPVTTSGGAPSGSNSPPMALWRG